MKEEEKNRSEKENWILGIIRNAKTLSEEQMWYHKSYKHDLFKD